MQREPVHLDLFAGIGLFSYAADYVWSNLKHVFCEIEDWPYRFLREKYPDAEIYRDIKEFDGRKYAGRTWLLTGGFPCQSFSVCGKRTGQNDNRWLWPEMLRTIKQSQPCYVLAENVYGILNIDNGETVDLVCADLENCGYEKPIVLDITADAEGLQTMERHIWIVTKAIDQRCKGGKKKPNKNNKHQGEFQGTDSGMYQRWDISESRFCRVRERVTDRIYPNQRERLRVLGNSIIPQVAYQIMLAIAECNENKTTKD